MTVLGVDGCRGSWLAAIRTEDGEVRWRLVASFRELYDAETDIIAVDIPIGLPETGSRSCDVVARKQSGVRGVSVFPAPARGVLDAVDYAEARRRLADLGGPSMSAQAFGIVRAVRDVDACVQPTDDDRIVECHPEVVFAAMNGGRALPRKRSASGVAARLQLLERWRPDALDVVGTAPESAPVDDALDALACLTVAERWQRGDRRLLGDGERDPRDLPMRIAY